MEPQSLEESVKEALMIKAEKEWNELRKEAGLAVQDNYILSKLKIINPENPDNIFATERLLEAMGGYSDYAYREEDEETPLTNYKKIKRDFVDDYVQRHFQVVIDNLVDEVTKKDE